MAEWLDDLVERTKAQYEEQRTTELRKQEEERLRHNLGVRYFKELAAWFTANAESFNQKFGSEALTVTGEGAQHVLNIVSHPNAKVRWTAQVRYTPTDGILEIFRNPGGSTPYSLGLNEDHSRAVAVAAGDAADKRPLDVEELGQQMFASMLMIVDKATV